MMHFVHHETHELLVRNFSIGPSYIFGVHFFIRNIPTCCSNHIDLDLISPLKKLKSLPIEVHEAASCQSPHDILPNCIFNTTRFWGHAGSWRMAEGTAVSPFEWQFSKQVMMLFKSLLVSSFLTVVLYNLS